MSISLREVIESGGYDLTTLEDARWVVAQQSNFTEIVGEAEETIERLEAEAGGYDG